jgi:molecular chaperone GrpE
MPKKNEDQRKIEELTSDLQRTRADFENYRKRIDIEKTQAREMGQISAIMKLLPVIDNIERAISYVPAELEDNQWAQGVKSLTKNLDKSIENMGISRIDSTPGTVFNPEFHDAIQFDEDATGETEIIEESLQPGYMLNGVPIRHAMVKVTKK